MLEVTDGTSTYRFAAVDVALLGVGLAEGRLLSASPAVRAIYQRADNTGFDFALADPDGTVEGYGISRGWTATLKMGFPGLAFASWSTVATYAVHTKPRRDARVLNVSCVAKPLVSLGRLALPAIEASDAYLFTTLRVSLDRIGEALPVRFGTHVKDGGGVSLVYLGINPSDQTLVWLVSSCALASSAFAATSLLAIYVDGVKIPFAASDVALVATGNYNYLVYKLTVDKAGRYGILDDKSFRSYRLARHAESVSGQRDWSNGRRGSPAGSIPGSTALVSGTRPVRALTADLLAATANVNRPLEAIEYLLQYHGTGLAVRDSTSYTTAKAFLADYAITISVDLLGNPDTREVIDGICQ